jgi:Glycosyl transferase family 11
MRNFLLVLLFPLFSFCAQEKPYVIAKLLGQLGNQLFQIAAATSLALDNDAIAVFPDLESSDFNIPLNKAHVFQNLPSYTPSEKPTFYYTEPRFSYDPIPYKPNMVINGYFQSEKYFKKHKKEILELFEPSDAIKSYLHAKYSNIINHQKTVSIHLRMYLDTKPCFHRFVGWDYVTSSINQFDKDSLFVVFSDQIPICKKRLYLLFPQYNFVFIEGNSHYHDLFLMSYCKSNIISNSSFSWWGAYLNKNHHKRVVAPSVNAWYGNNSDLDLKDLIPIQWQR